MIKKENIVLLDLCGTLYTPNTTFDFLNRYIYPQSAYYRNVKKIMGGLPGKVVNKILFSAFHWDLYRILACRSLKGKSRESLVQLAEDYYRDVLVTSSLEKVHQLLDTARLNGNRIVLVSASLDFIVEAVARHLGIQEYYSSQLAYENGICTGRFAVDLLGRKVELCVSKEIDLKATTVITDNLSDALLVKNSDEAYIVSQKKHHDFWKKIQNVKEIYVY